MLPSRSTVDIAKDYVYSVLDGYSTIRRDHPSRGCLARNSNLLIRVLTLLDQFDACMQIQSNSMTEDVLTPSGSKAHSKNLLTQRLSSGMRS